MESTMPTTQTDLDAINKAISESGVVRVKRATKVALAAFEAGDFPATEAGAWMNRQKITAPELFEAKPSSNPWALSFPNTPLPGKTTTKEKAIGEYIARCGIPDSMRMLRAASKAAGQELDIAGRPTGRPA
jgi:hypothetical protein